jgi:hypothetical protein
MAIREGSTVRWQWSGSTAEGKVVEIHRSKVTRTMSGSEITRNGSGDDPAYVIEQDDGAKVLKLRSEVEPVGR